MINEVNLLGYLPPFMQEYVEMQELFKAEQPNIQSVEDETEIIKNNQFITTCNITGIKKFESLLNIQPTEEDTLESRISRVLIRWNDIVPYTYRVLISKLKTLCGEGNYELVPDFNNYKLKIITHLNVYGQSDELDKIVDEVIPCNILVTCLNELEQNTTGYVNNGSPVATTKHLSIDTKTNTEYSITGILGSANTVATSKHIEINTI